MKTRFILRIVGAALLLLSPGVVLATDPPHRSSVNMTIDCTSACHLTHAAPGGNLTQSAGNVNLCQSCHNSSGLASALSINNSDKAVPGSLGTSHAFDVAAVNATYATTTPSNTEMQKRVMNAKIVCSTCHDQHSATSSDAGRPRISP